MRSDPVSVWAPQTKKDDSGQLLNSLGATTSDLSNSALNCVIDQHEFPRIGAITLQERENFARSLAHSTLDVPWGPEVENGDYRSMLEEGKRQSYESLP